MCTWETQRSTNHRVVYSSMHPDGVMRLPLRLDCGESSDRNGQRVVGFELIWLAVSEVLVDSIRVGDVDDGVGGPPGIFKSGDRLSQPRLQLVASCQLGSA